MKKPSPERLQRLALGIPGTEVAKALGVSRSTLYGWETGYRNIPPVKRAKLWEFLRKKSAA